jgi:serine/threonine protein kinase
MSFEVGDTVGDYQIIGLLGAGGMGKVYKAKNTISDRIDALKVLLPNLAEDQELADRFTREIKVLASLNHPNIAGLRTAFRVDNQLLMVMEFVEGTTLDERIKAGPISVVDAIGYITQVLAALGYAHKHGVIHRDIKPANMMLTADNVIKLMDFGIAKTKNDRKLTQTGATLGSLFYMSAEQVQGNELDGRSDLYSVGVSLYEMVTGTRPFKGNSDFDIMIAQIQQVPMPPIEMMPDLPKALNEIIVISLEKDPAKRFQTAEAFSAALGSITHALNATPVQASATGLMPTVLAPGSLDPMAVGGTISAPHIPTNYQPTVMAPPSEAPAATTPPPPDPSHGIPSPSGSKGYRGLYMTLGALIALAIIILAATQLPRIMKTQAR